jgi:hypothetical protein
MSFRTYPPALIAPVLPRAVPCFGFREPSKPARRRQVWDERCTRILELGRERPNAEIARLIEAQTGLRFSVSVISRHRAARGLDAPNRNEWTAPLRRWKPWQGHLAGKR